MAQDEINDEIHNEIERKWVIKKLPDVTFVRWLKIKQGYLPLPYASIRLRREKDEAGKKIYYLQSKDNGKGLIRQEWGRDMPKEVFEWLWPNTELCWLKKTRYIFIDDQGLVLEFDVFKGQLDGLIIMECEFETYEAAYAFEPPDWVEVIDDVTEEKAYGNKSLAKKGLPKDFVRP